ncbi:MAG: crossover junction endodeoxyribonuclease RuvC [Deltaproteobacteria bacterium]|nr:crossover junction endodeoxyribonuclease RuvC [Deltaproteobacteria bacterium]
MLVLGVDPGSITTGYGLIEKTKGHLKLIDAGHISSPGTIPFYERIHEIYRVMTEIMDRYRPAEMAIEDVFFAKNVKSSLKLGHARGAALIAAVSCGIRIFEYSPLEIKKSVVGYGRAGKEQVQAMVKVILGLPEILGTDTSDALAAAICHLNWARYERKA